MQHLAWDSSQDKAAGCSMGAHLSSHAQPRSTLKEERSCDVEGKETAWKMGGKLCQGEWVKVRRWLLASTACHSPSQLPPLPTCPTGRNSRLNPTLTSYLPISLSRYAPHPFIVSGNSNIPICRAKKKSVTCKMSTICPTKCSHRKREQSPSAQFGNCAHVRFSRNKPSDRKGNKQENVYRDHSEA